MTTQPEEPSRAAVAASVFAALDAAEVTISTAVEEGIREFLAKIKDVATLGEMYGWWVKEVDGPIMDSVRAVWTTQNSSLDGLEDYMARVRDRLVTGLEPPLPEAAFNQVRISITEGASQGWSTEKVSQDIAARLSWETQGEYWRTQKAEVDARIDAILDPLGEPGTPAREWARLHDPTVQSLRDQRNFATERLDDEMSYWKVRATRIARTESTGAFNASALSALHNEGWAFKEWMATPDSRTRESHRLADGQVVRLGSPFRVGGTLLMMPGDPTGQPEEVINCRCVVIGSDSPPKPVAELVAASADSHYHPLQARVPKGNGRLSGRWIRMPYSSVSQITNLWSGLASAIDFSEHPEVPGSVSELQLLESQFSREPWKSGALALTTLTKVTALQKLLEDENVDGDFSWQLDVVKDVVQNLLDYAAVDWYSDPDFDPDNPNPDENWYMGENEKFHNWTETVLRDPDFGDDEDVAEANATIAYKSSDASEINGVLRGKTKVERLRDPAQRPFFKAEADAMDRLMVKQGFKTPDHAIRVYRGGWFHFGHQPDHVGAVMVDKGFMSTSIDRGVSVGFADPAHVGVIEIEVPPDTPFLPGVQDEEELIFPHGSKIEMTSLDPPMGRLIPAKVKPKPVPPPTREPALVASGFNDNSSRYLWEEDDVEIFDSLAEAEAAENELLASASTAHLQARVPKGNGELSGRWIDMPGKIINYLSELPDRVPGLGEAQGHIAAIDDPFAPEARESIQKAIKALDNYTNSSNRDVFHAIYRLQDFISVDWYSDPDNPPKTSASTSPDTAKLTSLDQWFNDPIYPELLESDEGGPMGDRRLAKIVQKQGWGKPDVVSDAEFAELAAKSPYPVMYRGVMGQGAHWDDEGVYIVPDPSTPESATGRHAAFLYDDDPYMGRGYSGNGYYFAARRKTAEGSYSDGTPGSVIEAVLKPDANVIGMVDVVNRLQEGDNGFNVQLSDKREVAEKRMQVDPTDVDELTKIDDSYGLIRDRGRVAAMAGYDAISIPQASTDPETGEQEIYYIVLNRGALTVKQPDEGPTGPDSADLARPSQKNVEDYIAEWEATDAIPGSYTGRIDAGSAPSIQMREWNGHHFIVKQGIFHPENEAGGSDVAAAMGWDFTAREHDGWVVTNIVGTEDGEEYIDNGGSERTVGGSFKMAALDALLAMADRHVGNWRVDDSGYAIPIDHELINLESGSWRAPASDFFNAWFNPQWSPAGVPVMPGEAYSVKYLSDDELAQLKSDVAAVDTGISNLTSDYLLPDQIAVVQDRWRQVKSKVDMAIIDREQKGQA